MSKDRGRVAITKHRYTHINPQDKEGTETNQNGALPPGQNRALPYEGNAAGVLSQGTSDRSCNEDVVV